MRGGFMTGDLFAVELDDSEYEFVIRSFGPIAHRSISRDYSAYAELITTEDNDYLNNNEHMSLLSDDEIDEMIVRGT